jgi:hypothetical protein
MALEPSDGLAAGQGGHGGRRHPPEPPRHAEGLADAFQKKAKRGIATPKHELDLIKARLGLAQADYTARRAKPTRGGKS